MVPVSFFLLQLSLFILPINGKGNCGNNEKVDLKNCYTEYLKIYNFSSVPAFDQYLPFSTQSKRQNWTAEEIICKNFLTLYHCIENAEIYLTSKCFRNTFSLSDDDCDSYVIDYRQGSFQCQGKGFKGKQRARIHMAIRDVWYLDLESRRGIRDSQPGPVPNFLEKSGIQLPRSFFHFVIPWCQKISHPRSKNPEFGPEFPGKGSDERGLAPKHPWSGSGIR